MKNKVVVSLLIGSGLYINEYPIDDKYAMRIGGGSTWKKPLYMLLVNKENDRSIDIRYEDIDSFID